MSGRSTLIEMLAARLGRGAQHVEAAPQLREVLASALPARASAQESAWQTSRPLFHATDADLDGPLRPTRRPGFPEPTGISFAETPQVAEQFGGAVYPHYARGELGNAEQFMARAREHMARGMNSEQASAATQREFAELGYAGVRWGTGENVIFDSGDIISALDPQVARAGALSVTPSARSAEQGASVLRDGRFMRPESDYAAAHSELPAPSLRGALSEINASRIGPDAGPVQGENGTTLYRGSATGGRRGRWLTPDETAAADYGPVTSSVEDVSRATPIRDFGDLELALGNRSGVLGRMDERNADVWDALDDPAVQQALRDEGHSAVRLMDDVSPTGRRHESYLVLGRTAPDGGPVQAGRAPQAGEREPATGPTAWEAIGALPRSAQNEGGTLYHGNASRLGEIRPRLFATNDVETASFFAKLDRNRTGGARRLNTIEPHFTNPMEIDGQGHMITEARMRDGYLPQILDEAEAVGHDAVIFRNVLDGPGAATRDQMPIDVTVILNPRSVARGRTQYLDNPSIMDRIQDVFTSRARPNAGSDRNALQRALRERMERE